MLPSQLFETFPFLADSMYWSGFGSAIGVVVALRITWWAVGKLGPKPEPDLTPPPIKAPATPPEQADNWEIGSPQPNERRHQFRRIGNPVPVLFRGPQGQFYESRVLDRSRGGLRLLVPRPVEVGTGVWVRAPNAPSSSPWVEANVVWCAEKAGKVQVGVEFVTTPPWNVLLLFG
ncbi:MAG TPA: PilZ domain-containing protein [Gemmataceae bacterium]|jgi:hypothetical protein